MRWLEKQARLEERVHDCIDEIADEFDLEVPFYPEAYFLTKKSQFEEFCLGEHLRELFEDTKARKTGECWANPSIIWITNYTEDLGEECSHSLNFILSGSKKYSSLGDTFFIDVLSEVCGFLGSKIITPRRPNPFLIRQDIYQMPPEKIALFLDEYYEIGVHQQGYCLAEIMHYEYLKGNLKKQEIAKLFKTNFEKKGLALETFDKLRKKYWPHPN